MLRALAGSALIGIPAGILGCWIILYRSSYATESVAHSIFPGLVVASLLGIPLLLGAAPALVLGAIAIALLSRLPRVDRDTAVAAVITGLFGLGSMLALSADSPPRLETALFGDILGLTNSDLFFGGLLALAVLIGLWLAHDRLLAVGFDPQSAPNLGIRPATGELILMVLLAATVLVAVQGLGNLLVVAVMVGPAATARLLSDRLASMMLLAALLAVGLSALGLYLSYYAGTAAGASIALTVIAAYLIVLAASRLAQRQPRSSYTASRYDL